MKKDDKRLSRSGMALSKIKREDLENLFSALVGRGEAVEKDRDKFITKVLDNFRKRGSNIKKKIMNALKATLKPNREEIKKLNKRVKELVKEIYINFTNQGKDLKFDVSYEGRNNEIVVLTPHVDLDTINAPDFEKKIEKQLALNKYKIIVHLPYCGYVESPGWGVMVSEIREIRENNGDIVVADMSPYTRGVYELMEFSSILKSYDSLNEAIAAFSGQPHTSKPAIQKPAPKAEPAPAQARKPDTETGKPETAPGPSAQPEQAPASEKEPDIYSYASSELGKRIINVVILNPYYESKEISKALKLPQYGGKKAGRGVVKKELKAMGLFDRQHRFMLSHKSRVLSGTF